MNDDFAHMQVFLGDGAPAAPHRQLLDELPKLLHSMGWASCSLDQATRRLRVAAADRWTVVTDDRLAPFADGTSAASDFEEVVSELALPLSRRWPVVALRLAGGRALTLLLFRDGALVDRYANRPRAEERWSDDAARQAHAGSPEAWADLLGTRRNASRLERIWGVSAAAEQVLPQTAEIVGWQLAAGGAGTELGLMPAEAAR
jgi:hypothetical protein